MNVAKWMTKSVLAIKPKDTVKQAREIMNKYRVNQLPVVIDDKAVGIVTDRDVREAYLPSVRLLHGKDIDDFADSHVVEGVMTYSDDAQFCPRASSAGRQARRHYFPCRYSQSPNRTQIRYLVRWKVTLCVGRLAEHLSFSYS